MSVITNKLSTVGANLQGSEIRRLFAISMRPNVISFAGGLPDPGSFPAEKVAEISARLLREKGEIYLQYGPSRGTQEGIAAATNRMARRNITVDASQVIMTSGSQQAIDLMTKVFVDPGQVILVESPTFIGALGVFRNIQAETIGAPMDENGIIPDELEKLLNEIKRANKKVKFLYLIPNFQNPTGLTMSLERRQQVLALAEEHDFLILEDDPYGELWFSGGLESVRPLKSMDQDNRVVYTSSFSKIISPGIRLGWVAAAPEIIERFDMAKQMLDVCSPPLIQGVAHELTVTGFLDEHINRLRGIYQSRRDAMLEALSEYMPEGVHWTKPDGGFYIWVTLPEKINALDMLDTALANNVAYVIGSAFHADGSGKNTLRISFCHEPEETITEGIKRLAKAVAETI